MSKIRPYNPDRSTFLSAEIFDKYRYNLGLHAQRLLFGLASCLDQTQDMFPNWEIDIHGIFEYLGVSNSNKRYEIVHEAFTEIQSNPLQFKDSAKKWGGIAWLSEFKYDESKSTYVQVEFNETVKPFLLTFKRYCEIKAKHYNKLGTQYSTWLYPYFKNYAKLGKWEISLERLKEYTYNEKEKSYNPNHNKNATTDFLRRVIGVERKKDSDGNYQWQYTENSYKLKSGEKRTKTCGTLYEISQNTDIIITAEALKTQRTYDRVVFYIKFTNQAKSLHVRKKKQIAFESKQYNLFNEGVRVHMSQVLSYAQQSNMTAEQYAKGAGYVKKGKWYYKIGEQKRKK